MIKNLIKKLFTFFKYIYSAGICYIIDIIVFYSITSALKNAVLNYILLATIFAKIISSFTNFILNKNKVFNIKETNKKNKINLFFNYYLLVVVQIISSAIVIDIFYKLTGFNLVIIKFLVDCCILVVNYFVQKNYIFNNKFIDFEKILKSIFDFVKENKLICVIMLLSIGLHIAVLLTLGVEYGLNSDDASYIQSGIYFKENLTIIMHGVKSAQIMPGMTYIIALISFFTGNGLALTISLKIIWILLGVLSILGIYKTVRIFSNKIISSIAAMFLLAIDFIWMDNIILTETPFMFGFIFLIYSSIMLGKTSENKYFYQVIVFYILCLLLKANIAPYPLFLIIYLLLKKYNIKTLGKQLLISGAILAVFFVPWIIRNYIVFERFIPLTYGAGNPLLLGTYQGYNYPEDDEVAYNNYIEQNASEEMKSYLNHTNTEKDYLLKYYSLEKDGMIAKYRMKQWWNTDKLSMLKSYLMYKPKVITYGAFFWETFWRIESTSLLKVRLMDIILTVVSIIVIIFNKKYVKELLLLLSVYFFQVLVYSYTLALNRYGQTLLFIRFIIIGIGLQILFDFIMSKCKNLRTRKNKVVS